MVLNWHPIRAQGWLCMPSACTIWEASCRKDPEAFSLELLRACLPTVFISVGTKEHRAHPGNAGIRNASVSPTQQDSVTEEKYI